MLLREGEYDGVRLLGSSTVRFMTRNHLPEGKDLGALNTGGFAETTFDGVGFGLGVAVIEDPVPGRTPGTEGSFYWATRGRATARAALPRTRATAFVPATMSVVDEVTGAREHAPW
jgi:hypothetical protein